jgi:hypothetical protein
MTTNPAMPSRDTTEPTATGAMTFEQVIEQLRLLGTSDRLLGLYELGIEACVLGEPQHAAAVLHELIGSLDYTYSDIAEGFRRVYDYCLEEAGQGRLDTVGFILTDLRDTLLRAMTDSAIPEGAIPISA